MLCLKIWSVIVLMRNLFSLICHFFYLYWFPEIVAPGLFQHDIMQKFSVTFYKVCLTFVKIRLTYLSDPIDVSNFLYRF